VLVGAPAYYARFGFQPAKPHGLDNEYGADEEFMVLELRKGSLAAITGLVRYAPEFAEL
jgi:putative acetyltransferase